MSFDNFTMFGLQVKEGEVTKTIYGLVGLPNSPSLPWLVQRLTQLQCFSRLLIYAVILQQPFEITVKQWCCSTCCNRFSPLQTWFDWLAVGFFCFSLLLFSSGLWHAGGWFTVSKNSRRPLWGCAQYLSQRIMRVSLMCLRIVIDPALWRYHYNQHRPMASSAAAPKRLPACFFILHSLLLCSNLCPSIAVQD